MSDLLFKPLAEDDLGELNEWHQDAELANRYGGNDWPRKLWEQMKTDRQRQCFIAWEADRRVGYIDMETHPEEHLAWIGLAIPSVLRRQGWGKRILQEFLERSEVREFREIRAGIEHDNTASVRCFSSVGFKPMSEKPDEEGIVDCSLILRNSKRYHPELVEG